MDLDNISTANPNDFHGQAHKPSNARNDCECFGHSKWLHFAMQYTNHANNRPVSYQRGLHPLKDKICSRALEKTSSNLEILLSLLDAKEAEGEKRVKLRSNKRVPST